MLANQTSSRIRLHHWMLMAAFVFAMTWSAPSWLGVPAHAAFAQSKEDAKAKDKAEDKAKAEKREAEREKEKQRQLEKKKELAKKLEAQKKELQKQKEKEKANEAEKGEKEDDKKDHPVRDMDEVRYRKLKEKIEKGEVDPKETEQWDERVFDADMADEAKLRAAQKAKQQALVDSANRKLDAGKPLDAAEKEALQRQRDDMITEGKAKADGKAKGSDPVEAMALKLKQERKEGKISEKEYRRRMRLLRQPSRANANTPSEESKMREAISRALSDDGKPVKGSSLRDQQDKAEARKSLRDRLRAQAAERRRRVLEQRREALAAKEAGGDDDRKVPPVNESRNSGSRRPTPAKTSAAPGAAEEMSVDLPEGFFDSDVPAEDRMYRFSIKNGDYAQLLAMLERFTGIGVLGEPPAGKVSFVPGEELTFDEMLGKIRILLFKSSPLEPYWLTYNKDDGFFEVSRLNDITKAIPPELMFGSREAFESAGLSDNELILLLYTPDSVQTAVLDQVNMQMPDYVRVSRIPETNTITIIALVSDIHKYLSLVDFFDVSIQQDPTKLEKIEVDYIEPTLAVTKIRQLIDIGDDGSSRRPRPGSRRKGKDNVLDPVEAPPVILMPDDENSEILVRAVPSKIAEIREVLGIIDVEGEMNGVEPIIIPVENADVAELVETLRTIISATPQPSPTPNRRRTRRGRRTARKGAKASASAVKADDITMIPYEPSNSIIVIASEDGVERVRSLVQQFDRKAQVGPMRIELQYNSATVAVAELQQLITAANPRSQPTIYADANEDAIWVAGTERQVAQIQEYLQYVDIEQPEIQLFHYKPVNQAPTFLENMLIQYISESQGQEAAARAAAGKNAKSKRRRRTPRRGRNNQRAVTAAKITSNDDENILFVWCTQDEWDEFLPLLEQMDQIESPDDVVEIAVEQISPADALAALSTLMPAFSGGRNRIENVTTENSILIQGASPQQIERIHEILAKIDKKVDWQERRFELEYIEPEEMIRLINELVVNKPTTGAISAKPRARRGKGKSRRAPAAPAAIKRNDLQITTVDNVLVVRTTPEKLEEIELLVQEFDVTTPDTRITRTYELPASVNPSELVTTLRGIVGGTSAQRSQASSRRRGRGRRQPKVGQPATDEGILYIPQPEFNRLIVKAEKDEFEEIDSLLDVLIVEEVDVKVTTSFIPVRFAEPEELLEQIQPLLQVRMQQMVENGLLPKDFGGGGKAPARKKGGKGRATPSSTTLGGSKFHIQADKNNDRLVILAPPVVTQELVDLVAEFDLPPSEADEPILREVKLVHIDAAAAIDGAQKLMANGTQSNSGNKRRPGRNRRRPRRRPAPTSSEDEVPLVMLPAPGGGAVILRGLEEDVDQAEEFIAQLDVADGQPQLRVYTVSYGDLNQVAEVLIHTLSPVQAAPSKGGNRNARNNRGGKGGGRGGVVDPFEDTMDFSTTKTYIVGDVWMQTDEIESTLLVSATPASHAKILNVVQQFGGDILRDETTGETITTPLPPPSVPQMVYKLQHKEGYDASLDLELLLEKMWTPQNKLPQVDYVPFMDTLIVRYPDASRFEDIERIIAEYVDVPSDEDVTITQARIEVPPGLTPEEAIIWMKTNFPGVEIEAIPVGDDKEQFEPNELVKPRKFDSTASVSPCVLPGTYRQALSSLALAASLTQSDPKAKKPVADEPTLDEQVAEIARKKLAAAQEAKDQADDDADTDADQVDEDATADAVEDAAAMDDEDADEPLDDEPLDDAGLNLATVGEGDSPDVAVGMTRLSGGRKVGKGLAPGETRKLKIYYDPKNPGSMFLEGSGEIVSDVETGLEEVTTRLKDMARPDIRVYRVRYISVYEAQSLLDQVLNESARAAQQAARVAAARQRAQAQANRRRGQPQAQQNNKSSKGNEPGKPPTPGGNNNGGKGGEPKTPSSQRTSGVTIVPNPRDRTLILKANTADYPMILELLATIDQPQPIEYKIRTYRLSKLNASEVASTLTQMLGLDQSSGARRTAPSRNRRGGAAAGRTTSGSAPQPLPQQIMQDPATGGSSLGVFPSDIKIESNEGTNTIIATAPESALDYIGKIINELENVDVPERLTQHFHLQFADPSEVSEYLTNFYSEGSSAPRSRGGRGGRGGQRSVGGAMDQPTFLPFPQLGLLTVVATADDMSEIEELIAKVDVDSGEGSYQAVRVPNTGAGEMAGMLQQMYGEGSSGGRGRRGQAAAGSGPKFIGEEGSDILFFSASERLVQPIMATINEIEEQNKAKVALRVIMLENAKPSAVAETVTAAYGSSRRRSRTSATDFQINGDDASMQLFVRVSNDDLFAEIESLVKSLDKPQEFPVQLKVYKLTYASAREVKERLARMLTEYLRMKGGGRGDLDAFSVDVDDKSNALIVLGNQSVFNFVEENLPLIDNPLNKRPEDGYLMVGLKNANAQEVAQNINRLWDQRTLQPGQTKPQVEANRELNMLYIRGAQDMIDQIKREFIDPLEEYQPPQLKNEVFTLKFAPPEAVADAINQFFTAKRELNRQVGGGRGSNAIDSYVAVVPDVTTNQLIVEASEKNIEFIRTRIAELDREDRAAAVAQHRVYHIKYADPNSIVNTINQWQRQRTTSRGRGRTVAASEQVTATVDGGTQSVIVFANESNHKIIADLIQSLDNEETLDVVTETIKLEYANAEQVARMVQQVKGRSSRTRRGQQELTVTPDTRGNRVVIRGREQEIVQIRDLIETLDVEPDLDAERVVRGYALNYADPGGINAVILNMFRWDRRTPASPSEQVTSAVDWGTRTVIVTASEKNHATIQEMINQIDVESAITKEIFQRKLEHANAEELARTLQNIFRSRRRTGRGEQPIEISADVGSNSLIISATQAEMTEVDHLLETLDVQPEIGKQRQMRSFALEKADSWGVQNAITQLFRGSFGRTRNPRDQVTAVADWGSNSVIVSASPDKMEEVATLIEQIDKGGQGDPEVHVVALKYAEPSSVSRALNDIYVRSQRGMRGRGSGPSISISEIQNSQSILVSAPDEDYQKILATVTELDQESFTTGNEIRVVQLIKTDAQEMQDVLENYLRRSGGGGRGRRGGSSELAGDIRLSILAGSNALVVSGDKSEVDRVEGVIRQLDDSGEAAREPKLIKLRYADVTQIMPKLEEMFLNGSSSGSRGRGRGRRGSVTSEPPTIVAYEMANALIVRATPRDMHDIEQAIEMFDSEEAGVDSPIRVIRMKPGLNVEELAEKLEEAFSNTLAATSTSGGRGRRGGGGSQQISIQPDKRTNSLIVSGTPSKFDQVEQMARQLEEMGPTGNIATVVVRPSSLTPEQVKDLIEKLKNPDSSSSSSSSSRNRSRRRR